MEKDIQEILLTEAQIQAKVQELGEILTKEYKDKKAYIELDDGTIIEVNPKDAVYIRLYFEF